MQRTCKLCGKQFKDGAPRNKCYSCRRPSKRADIQCVQCGEVINLDKRYHKLGWKCQYCSGRHFKVNHEYFSKLNVENCYWAGFIAADGYIMKNRTTIRIVLQSKDKSQLERFIEDVQFTGSIYDEIRHLNGKAYGSVGVYITSKQLCNDLANVFNVTNCKSLTLQPPNLESLELQLAFIKGYIDGDGTIYHKNGTNQIALHVLGTWEVTNWLKDTLHAFTSKGGIYLQRSSKAKHNFYSYEITGHAALAVLKELHNLPVKGLERKWSTYVNYDGTIQPACILWSVEELLILGQYLEVMPRRKTAESLKFMNNLLNLLPNRTWSGISSMIFQLRKQKKEEYAQ